MKDFIEIDNTIKLVSDAIEKGFSQLTADDIKDKIVGKQFLGGYLQGFQYIISINKDGSLEGKNNYHHYDIGHWQINISKNTLSVTWQYGWDNTTTHLYERNAQINMYDENTGVWRTSLNQEISPKLNIKNYHFK